jgi:ferredoxin
MSSVPKQTFFFFASNTFTLLRHFLDTSVSVSESVLHRCRVSNVMLREGCYGGNRCRGCREALAHGDGDGSPVMRTVVEGGDSLWW